MEICGYNSFFLYKIGNLRKNIWEKSSDYKENMEYTKLI